MCSPLQVGELSSLDKPLSAFIRLSEAASLGDLTEVPVPTRFIFILLGPTVRKLKKLRGKNIFYFLHFHFFTGENAILAILLLPVMAC